MDRVTSTELRRNLARYLDRAVDDLEPVMVTRKGGKGTVVIISADDFAGWEETVYLLKNPSNAAHLLSSIKGLE